MYYEVTYYILVKGAIGSFLCGCGSIDRLSEGQLLECTALGRALSLKS